MTPGIRASEDRLPDPWASEGLDPSPDRVCSAIVDYVFADEKANASAYETAWLSLMDSVGVALRALAYPACTRLLGPWIPGGGVTLGARVLGTRFELDPIKAAFDTGALIRWLDYNDTWLAAEWAHPSDNLGALLAVADYHNRALSLEGAHPVTIGRLLEAMIHAYEIQGILALTNSLNAVGIDHVVYVRVASAALAARLFGASRKQVLSAVTGAFADGGSLRVYRHFPNTGSRKSWAAADATARGVQLALMSLKGEMGYPQVLTTPRWGFNDVVLKGEALALARPLRSYVMENILFKVNYPAEFHGQTAAEAAVVLHPEIRERIDQIERIDIETQRPALRIIDKSGPLRNPADRDHCLQYIVASALLRGRLVAEDYEDVNASDPAIDTLRSKMQVTENAEFTRHYYDSEKRFIGNAIMIRFRDGSMSRRVAVEVPVGHRQRRAEARPLLWEKFKQSLSALPSGRAQALTAFFEPSWQEQAERSVSELIDLLIPV